MNRYDTIMASLTSEEAKVFFQDIYREWADRGTEVVKLSNRLSDLSPRKLEMEMAIRERDRQSNLNYLEQAQKLLPSAAKTIEQHKALIASIENAYNKAKMELEQCLIS